MDRRRSVENINRSLAMKMFADLAKFGSQLWRSLGRSFGEVSVAALAKFGSQRGEMFACRQTECPETICAFGTGVETTCTLQGLVEEMSLKYFTRSDKDFGLTDLAHGLEDGRR